MTAGELLIHRRESGSHRLAKWSTCIPPMGFVKAEGLVRAGGGSSALTGSTSRIRPRLHERGKSRLRSENQPGVRFGAFRRFDSRTSSITRSSR